MDSRRDDVALALEAAAAAVVVLRRLYGRELERFEKSPTDFATDADLAAEAAILGVLREGRPDDGFVGEESGAVPGSAGARRWLVDPLCGTLNYDAGTPLAAVNIALVAGPGPGVAVCADPISGECFWTDGDSAWCRGAGGDAPLRPSARTRLVELNCDGAAGRLGSRLVGDPAFRAAFSPRVVSSTLAVAWVAAGRRAAYVTDGALRDNVHYAAGIALCVAAGCVVTDLAGDALHTGSGLVSAADRTVHERLIGMIATQR